jgi:hypothetical protein
MQPNTNSQSLTLKKPWPPFEFTRSLCCVRLGYVMFEPWSSYFGPFDLHGVLLEKSLFNYGDIKAGLSFIVRRKMS